MLAWVLACEPTREILADEERALGALEAGGQRLEVEATFHGWHHGAGWGDDGPQLSETAYFVGFEVTAPEGRVHGDVDATWELNDRAAAEAAWRALSLAWCAGPDRAAYRVLGPAGAATPWRLWLPDPAGGAGGLVEQPPGACEEALASVGSAEAWLATRASGGDVCVHLARRGRREDALRCLLREPPRPVGTHVSRQDLPGGADDPGWDGQLLAILTDTPREAALRFVPYRVTDLTDAVADRAAVLATARALAARPGPALPWEAELVARTAVEAGDEGLAQALASRLRQDDADGVAATRLAAGQLGRRWPERSRALRAAADAAGIEEPAPWLPPEMAPGPPCAAWHRDTPDRCPR